MLFNLICDARGVTACMYARLRCNVWNRKIHAGNVAADSSSQSKRLKNKIK